MLLQNTNILAANPITLTGGVLAGESVFLGLRDQSFASLFAGQGALGDKNAVPTGYSPEDAWYPALKPGGLAAGSECEIVGTAILAAGRNAVANSDIALVASANAVGVASVNATATSSLSSSANATSVILIQASATASLTGSATASAAASASASSTMTLASANANLTLAPVNAVASAVCSLVSSANAVGVFSAQASSSINVSASATVSAQAFATASSSSVLVSAASMGANAFCVASAGGPESLSPQGLATAVWSAIDSANNQPGTMGAKLNAAASAGDPWSTLIPGSYAPGSAGYLMSQLALENPAIATQLSEVWQRLGLDPSNPLLNTQTQISSGTVVIAVSGDANSTTLTRA